MSLPILPSPPIRPPPPPATSLSQDLTSMSPSMTLELWWPFALNSAPSPAERLPILRNALRLSSFRHERYMSNYHRFHRRIHAIYDRIRSLEAARHQTPPVRYRYKLAEQYAKRDAVSDLMGFARDDVRAAREEIKRVREAIAELEKMVAAEKSGGVINPERAAT